MVLPMPYAVLRYIVRESVFFGCAKEDGNCESSELAQRGGRPLDRSTLFVENIILSRLKRTCVCFNLPDVCRVDKLIKRSGST